MTASQAPEAVVRDYAVTNIVPVAVLPAQTAPSPHAGDCRGKMWDEAACSFRGRPESVKLARDFARETLTTWGLYPMCDDVTWVLSELVTNALSHGLRYSPGHGLRYSSRSRWARPIRVCLTLQLAHVLCMVSDPGDGAPVRKETDYFRECGRGLQVVESCSDRWGWNRLDYGGKVIWAAFRVPG